MSHDPRVHAYLDRTKVPARRVVPLTGDASDRRYFRVLSNGELPSMVLAVNAEPFDYSKLAFVNVAELLAQMPVAVPAIYDHADDLGILALEDLGDVTLQAHLGAAPAKDHAALYRQAVSIIDVMQKRGALLADAQYTPYGVSFDVEKLMWEFDFFIKHFLEAYRGVAFAAGERDALREECAAIVRELAAEPRVLCHRDYHSRNLMWHASRLYVIDFQDARMGPDTYDLVSLLRDSYVDIPDAIVEDLIAYYLALQGRMAEAAAFRERFDLMALQRNIKALGTFGYQTVARRNTVYIQYIPRTLRHARQNLAKHARHTRLRGILGKHIAELA
jgi:aminoglycoside/choline kinase family phosphotransferase